MSQEWVFGLLFCVCVKHLNRCKTRTLIYLSCRGVVGILGVTTQRRHSKFAAICNLDADCTYLRSLLQRLSSEPARRFVFPLHVWTVGAIWISTRITLGYFWWEAYVRMRVTNLDFILHYWRNSRLWFWSFRSICLFPLGYVDDGLPPLEFPTLWPDKCNENVFLHTRCVPHHNSIKQFWANMCDVGFDRMTWALRGISF